MDKPRFFRWFRVIPLIFVIGISAVVLFVHLSQDKQIAKTFYPVPHAKIIKQASQKYGVDPYLVCAVIKCESNWNKDAKSQAGAVGLMQILPDTAQHIANKGLISPKTYPYQDLFNPRNNIEYGVAYLAYLQSQLSSRDEVVAAYNAGPGKVQEWKHGSDDPIHKNITYAETSIYLANVNQTYEIYKHLYPDGIDS